MLVKIKGGGSHPLIRKSNKWAENATDVPLMNSLLRKTYPMKKLNTPESNPFELRHNPKQTPILL